MRSALFIASRAAFLGFFLLILTAAGHAGIAAYSERGEIDFDGAMALLNPYGTWAKVDGRWAYTPLDHDVPYTQGRWIYTEFGWTWIGTNPHSWLTEHYGYWKRNADHVWSWYPGPYWLPQTVEIRASPDGIGWRSAEVDRDGTFVESPADRFTKTDEWTFVTLQQFAGPITPAIIAKPAVAEGLLEESIESGHSYRTYRDLERPGPHPADFVNFGDGKAFAPMTPQEKLKASQRPAPKPAAKSDVPQPALAGVDPEDADSDPRQVNYWLTMSLPNLWAHAPPDAKRNEVYLYRPDFYQDQDGIERRITLWLDPSIRATEQLHLGQVLAQAHSAPAGSPAVAAAAVPAVPATSAEPPHANDPFVSPFEDSFRNSGDQPTPSASTKVAPKGPLSAAGAPIGTNAVPVTVPATVIAPASTPGTTPTP